MHEDRMYVLQHMHLMITKLHGRGWILASVDKYHDTDALVTRLRKESLTSAQAARAAAFLAYQKMKGQLYVFPSATEYFEATTVGPPS